MAIGVIERIFDNFEILHENYIDMPGTRRAKKDMYNYFETHGIDVMEVEQCITSLVSEYEKQGFLYGFRYAIALILDGGVSI